jgi:hypothetical protein
MAMAPCGYVESVTLEMAPSLATRFGGRLTFANRLSLADIPTPNDAQSGAKQ